MSEDLKIEKTEATEVEPVKEIKYFHCQICEMHERYEYFGNSPPFVKKFILLENAYVIEDPFLPPRQGEFLILGAHCIKCFISVCKDTNCSIYYEGTYCVKCAKKCYETFPPNVREKINKIVVS